MESSFRKRTGVETVLAAAWIGLLAYGFMRLLDHDYRPGTAIAAPSERIPIPDAGAQASLSSPFQLLVFVHPMCPCTRATLSNLDLLIARTGDRLAIQLVVFEPSDSDAGWDPSQEISTALANDHVTAICDPGGLLATQYGAVTSGSTVLYDQAGRRHFQGGITDSRGHAGESVGLETIAAIVNGEASEISSTPVFGCRILTSSLSGKRDAESALDSPPHCQDHEITQSASLEPETEREP